MLPRTRERFHLGLAFGAAVVGTLLLQTLRRSPWIGGYLTALVGLWFLVLPQLFDRTVDPSTRLFTSDRIGRDVALGLVTSVIVLPLFFLLFFAALSGVCHFPAATWIDCHRIFSPRIRWPTNFGLFVLSEWMVVAIPEEFFFRGFLQQRLEQLWPARRTFLGAPFGWAIFITSFLFALGHVIVQFNLGLFTRFFPGLLFGWLFARSRSILAPSIFHALCNVTMEVFQRSLLL